MKHPKPGFKVFIKMRVKHPLTRKHRLVFTDEAGAKYKDDGSIHTALIGTMFWFFFVFTQISLRYTIWTYLLGAILLVLHRLFRYFWTDFARFDEQGNEI